MTVVVLLIIAAVVLAVAGRLVVKYWPLLLGIWVLVLAYLGVSWVASWLF